MTQEFLLQNSWLIALALGSGLMLIWPLLTKGGGKRITVPQATLLINQQKAVLVDIRDDELVRGAGAIPHAKRVAIKELKDKADTLSKSKDTPLIVVCQVGSRSGAAATILKGAGYTQVYTLEGGVNAWKEAGMPTKKLEEAKATERAANKGGKAGKGNKAAPKAEAAANDEAKV
ncbi:rhodanese-like domain-containing protein [Limnobacter sp.]|uniref:rhodanese-like domain-containing protein n=1 Tax=Limnobacter sp. TaxID=2003368 RepID=UPI003518C8EB